MGSERSGMIKRCVAEELLKIGQRPWLKLRTTVLDLTEGLEQKVNYICCSGFQHGLSLRRTEDKYRLGIY
ncbi:hypothetical protein HMPREF1547_00067 [Blautia sp. KLE 1732]|nr:hypothetical protein HMPREF1547_00067 [Blautia sp. KLE 1732]